MLKDSVQERCCQHRVSHHLSPISNLFIGSENQGGCLVGITDESKEAVRLSP